LVTYTILAPNIFMDVWIPMIIGTALQQQQPVRLISEGQRQHSFIAVQDVAAFAVAAVQHRAALNQYIPLGGPEAVSWRDIIATTERVLQRSIPVETLAMGDMLPGFPEMITGMMTSLEMQDNIIPMQETAQRFNVQQTMMEQFVHHAFAGASTTS
jgi:NADH dehydrogenase